MVDYPVKREVFAADFRDRIIHHLLFNYISPIFERVFINDCYSCRKGRGTLYGIKRLDKHIRSCSQNYAQDCYVLKLDLQGYFMNINRQVLFDLVRKTLDKYGYLEMPDGIHWEDSEECELVNYLLPLSSLMTRHKIACGGAMFRIGKGFRPPRACFIRRRDMGCLS